MGHKFAGLVETNGMYGAIPEPLGQLGNIFVKII